MTPRNRLLLALVSAMIILVGCRSPGTTLASPFGQLRTTAREDVILKTAGPPEQTFRAVLNIDGERRELLGTSPSEFPLSVCWMTAEVRKTGGAGSLSFQVVAPRRMVSCCGLVEAGSSCWFAYHDGEIRSRQ